MKNPMVKEYPYAPAQVDYQRQLNEYQGRIANILESFTDGFFEVTTNWIVTYWNKQAELLLGMPREKVLGENLWEVYQDAKAMKFFVEYSRAMEENISVRFEEYYPAREVWLEVAAFPSGHGLSVYFKDISEQKKATLLLEEEKQKYSDLFNLSPLPQWVYATKNHQFLDVNEAAIKHYGYSREEFMSMAVTDIRPQIDIDNFYQLMVNLDEGQNRRRCNARHSKKNGEVIEVFVASTQVSFDGQAARLVMAIDRTFEVKTTKAMEASIARFDMVSKATSDAIWDLDVASGNIIWNHGLKSLFGYEQNQYPISWWHSRVHPDDLPNLNHRFDKSFDEHQSRLSDEYRFRDAEGNYRCVLDRYFVIFGDDGSPARVIGSMQDITERISQMNEIEDRNRKLREISWIQSHNIRGPLSCILGLTSLIQQENMSVTEIKELVGHLNTAAQKLDKVLEDIVDRTGSTSTKT